MEEDFKTTTSHTVIRGWAEAHNGKPALIVDPNQLDREVGLRLDFPGQTDEALLSVAHRNQDVTWEEFFKHFEGQALAFEYLPEPGETPLPDAYRFLKRAALKDAAEAKPAIDPVELARAARDDLPEYATHGGEIDNPHQGEVEFVEPEDVTGETGIAGDMPDAESDDDTTQNVADLGIVDPEDAQAKHDRQS